MNGQTPQILTKKSSRWPIAAIIAVGGIVGGLLYGVWQAGVKTSSGPMPTAYPVAASPSYAPLGADGDQKTAQLAQVGSSTEIADIDQDLQNTPLDGLDTEMNAMAGEIQ